MDRATGSAHAAALRGSRKQVFGNLDSVQRGVRNPKEDVAQQDRPELENRDSERQLHRVSGGTHTWGMDVGKSAMRCPTQSANSPGGVAEQERPEFAQSAFGRNQEVVRFVRNTKSKSIVETTVESEETTHARSTTN
jgi:hypothetical protein